jgi:hypothetical protein
VYWQSCWHSWKYGYEANGNEQSQMSMSPQAYLCRTSDGPASGMPDLQAHHLIIYQIIYGTKKQISKSDAASLLDNKLFIDGFPGVI